MSECRDLLTDVQEHRHTIADIRSFVRMHFSTSFMASSFDGGPASRLTAWRSRRTPSMTNLDHWQAFETEHPDAFAGMYQFWLSARLDRDDFSSLEL